MARYIDADKLIAGRVSNDPVVIAANLEPTADVKEVIHTTNDCKIDEHGWIFSTCHNCGNGGWCANPDQKFCSKCGAMFDRVQWSETE